jgi:glutathione transport system ATP-binding protein
MDKRRLLDIRDLTVAFGGRDHPVRAISDISFHVDRGETVAVVGESGSGKSVTALSILQLLGQGADIVSGAIDFRRKDGSVVDLARLPEPTLRTVRGAEISMIFQEPMTSLNPVVSVGDQVAETIAQHRRVSMAEAREQARLMLELVRIADPRVALRRHPHEMSGGMRQRVMIAMALCCRPSLLIADEPTTALDVTIQAQILSIIRSLQQEMDMAVLFISHDMGVVAEMADRVVVMRRGALIETGDARQIYSAPTQPYTRMLLDAAPRLGAMAGKDYPEPFDGGEGALASIPREKEAGEPPVLSVRNLTTRFVARRDIIGRVRSRVHAVEQVSFDIDPGETLSLVGESGCGKSTIGRSVLQLATPLSGRILFEGVDVAGAPRHRRRQVHRGIQYVFQDPFASLDPRMAIGASIAEPIHVHKLARGGAIRNRVAELLSSVGLSPDHARRYPHEFSGGQRQRICIARALAAEPKLIIADESVAALDVSVQAQIVDLMIDLQRRLGIAYLFISHDMAVVERISHRVAVMYLGQIVEIGSRRDIFENPQHPYTRRLLAAAPVADPASRSVARLLDETDIPSPIRAIGDEPVIRPLVAVGAGHFAVPADV